MRSVIRFLNAKNMKTAEIRQLCYVYGEHAMNSSMVQRWVQVFNEGRENVHDDPRSGWPSVVNLDLVHAVEEKITENRWFTIMSLSLHFPQISQSLLHKIVSDKLKFRKLCARWVLKMLTEEHKLKRQTSVLNFLTQYSKEGDNLLSRVVTGDKIRVSHTTPKLKQHSTLHRQRRRNSSRPLQLGRSRARCFATEKAFCLWTSCLKTPQSMQVSTVTHLKNCIAQSRINNVACLAGVLWWFMTMPVHTLPPQCKISSRHLAGNNSIIPPYIPDLVPSDFHLFHDDNKVKEAFTTCFAS